MKIKSELLPREIVKLIQNPDPTVGEDIIIENEKGETIGVIIQPVAYNFFLKKLEEREDEIDSDPELSEPYDTGFKTSNNIIK